MVTVGGNGDFIYEGTMLRPRMVRAGSLFEGRVGRPTASSKSQRERARELAELYASMKAMRYGRR